MQDRRHWCKHTGAMLLANGLFGCEGSGKPPPPQRIYTEEEKGRMHKFRGIGGYESVLSGFGETLLEGVYAEVLDEKLQYYESGNFWAHKDSKSGRAIYPPGPPKFLSVKLMDPSTTKYAGAATDGKHIISGTVFGEWKVPIADRIPNDLLDDLRATPRGELRIKIRFHKEGVLLGWDIERRPGFDSKIRDEWGEARYVAPVHSFAGGDFREADIDNGKAIRKGWYIHPQTKQRIQTDF